MTPCDFNSVSSHSALFWWNDDILIFKILIVFKFYVKQLHQALTAAPSEPLASKMDARFQVLCIVFAYR